MEVATLRLVSRVLGLGLKVISPTDHFDAHDETEDESTESLDSLRSPQQEFAREEESLPPPEEPRTPASPDRPQRFPHPPGTPDLVDELTRGLRDLGWHLHRDGSLSTRPGWYEGRDPLPARVETALADYRARIALGTGGSDHT
jgi:hypothetical protein